jgi:hypothetical protein
MSSKTSKLHKLNIASPEVNIPLNTNNMTIQRSPAVGGNNWIRQNTPVRPNQQDFNRLTSEELGKRLHKPTKRISDKIQPDIESFQISTLANSVSPNRVGILTKSDVHQLLRKPR